MGSHLVKTRELRDLCGSYWVFSKWLVCNRSSRVWNDIIGFETNENCVPKWMVNNGDSNDIIEKNRCEDREEYKESRTSLEWMWRSWWEPMNRSVRERSVLRFQATSTVVQWEVRWDQSKTIQSQKWLGQDILASLIPMECSILFDQ